MINFTKELPQNTTVIQSNIQRSIPKVAMKPPSKRGAQRFPTHTHTTNDV